MNNENSKSYESHRFRFSLADKLIFKNPNKNIALCNLSIYYTYKNIKSACSNNKLKFSAPTWNDTFDLLDGSYSIADIQDYFEFIIKKHETYSENPPVQIHPNKIKENRIQIRISISGNDEIIREHKKDVEDVSKLESVEVVLVHCNLVNNNYLKTSKVLFTFVPNKQFEQLINIAPHSLTMLGTTNTEFSFTEVWFTDQNSEPLEIEDNVNWTLIIELTLKWDIQRT